MRINVVANVNDPEVIAELSALQWLLGHRSIFGPTQTGKGLKLTVTSGAIKKLLKNVRNGVPDKSAITKPHLIPYGRFLWHRFSGLEIDVSKDASWLLPRAQNDIETVEIREPLSEVIEIPNLGLVEVTDHAITQYASRLANVDQPDLWRLFRQAVARLRRVDLSEEQVMQKAAKHGEAGELWVNDALRWGFVVIRTEFLPKIVTAHAIKMTRV